MYAIESGIVELLVKHNCVVIPGFGGFIGKKISAQVDLENGLVFPPSKQFLFNVNLIENDGLLVHYLASKSAISFQIAEKHIVQHVNEWQEELAAGRTVIIRQLGSLQRNSTGILEFTQDTFSNLLLQSFGLRELAFVPAIEEEIPVKIIEINKTKKPHHLWKYAAAACILPIAFYSFWLPTQTNVLQSKVISLSDFNPFKGRMKALYEENKSFSFLLDTKQGEEKITIQPTESDSISNYIFDEYTVFPVRNEKEKSLPGKKSLKSSNKSNNLINVIAPKRAKFKVVVGCFSKMSNVEKFKQKLKADGFDAAHEKFGTLFRVVISSTDTLSVATDMIDLSRQKGYKGWLLKK